MASLWEGPLRDLDFTVLQKVLDQFGCVLGVIVLLEDPAAIKAGLLADFFT